MTERPKLWRRVCSACGQFDESHAAIAPEQGEEAVLVAKPWACPSRAASEAIAA